MFYKPDQARGSSFNTGFIPFRGEDQLRDLYNGYSPESQAFSELQFTSIALAADEFKNSSVYVELISFTPRTSFGRFSFGSQLSTAEVQEDTVGSLESMAIQKFLNGGGNFSLNFNRPLVFAPFMDNKGHFLTNASATVYADVQKMNSSSYDPGIGAQLNLDFDLRLFSNESEVMYGNIIRVGIRGRALYNIFDAKYVKTQEIDQTINNLGILSAGGYVGIGPLYLEVNYNFATKKDVINANSNFIKFSLQPVKY
jgi:hypothetical protein